jgi:serine/threonine protein phosphatase PrpC
MSTDTSDRVQVFLDRDFSEASLIPFASGMAAVYTARCPDKETPNEDAAALIACGDTAGVLAVADGFGGQPAGEQAVRLALKSVIEQVEAAMIAGESLRSAILNGFDVANEAVTNLGVGAATTLIVLEIDSDSARTYHVGDSTALIVGQRGKLKLQTVSHSPVGYAVEAGWLEEGDALHHEDLHIVSNMVGSPEMRIDVGPSVQLRPRDTVLIGTDGLFDNLPATEITELIRVGPLAAAAGRLVAACDQRMRSPDAGQASKPDDLTFIAYRSQA